MREAVYRAGAGFLCTQWLPELAAQVQPWAAGLVAMSNAAVDEVLGTDLVSFEERVLSQQPILFALAVGHDWARTVVRTPLHLEEQVAVAVMRQIEPIAAGAADGGPHPDVPHGVFAIGVLREVSRLWHDSLPVDAVEDVLFERGRLVAHIEERCVDAPERDLRLAAWFDVGAAHAHLDRILSAIRAADGEPPAAPTIDPVTWISILDPEVFTEPLEPGWPPRARRLR